MNLSSSAQGEEPEEFWGSLDATPDDIGHHEAARPRGGKKMVHCTINAAGNFIVDDVDGFEQDVSDMSPGCLVV